MRSSHLYPPSTQHELARYSSTYPLYSLVSSLYSHISPYPSTYTIYSLVSSLYSHISPYPSTYTLYSLVSSLYSHIPVPLQISPLLPCIVFILPYIPVSFYIYPLLPCIVLTLLYIPLAFYVSSLLPFFCLLIIPLMNLQDNGLGSSSVKPRSKRSYHHRHSTKLSIKDLALELAKKLVSSIQKLDSTLSTTVNGLKPSFPWQFQFNLSVFCLI